MENEKWGKRILEHLNETLKDIKNRKEPEVYIEQFTPEIIKTSSYYCYRYNHKKLDPKQVENTAKLITYRLVKGVTPEDMKKDMLGDFLSDHIHKPAKETRLDRHMKYNKKSIKYLLGELAMFYYFGLYLAYKEGLIKSEEQFKIEQAKLAFCFPYLIADIKAIKNATWYKGMKDNNGKQVTLKAYLFEKPYSKVFNELKKFPFMLDETNKTLPDLNRNASNSPDQLDSFIAKEAMITSFIRYKDKIKDPTLRKAIRLRYEGYSLEDVAREIGTHRKNISKMFKKLKTDYPDIKLPKYNRAPKV